MMDNYVSRLWTMEIGFYFIFNHKWSWQLNKALNGLHCVLLFTPIGASQGSMVPQYPIHPSDCYGPAAKTSGNKSTIYMCL